MPYLFPVRNQTHKRHGRWSIKDLISRTKDLSEAGASCPHHWQFDQITLVNSASGAETLLVPTVSFFQW